MKSCVECNSHQMETDQCGRCGKVSIWRNKLSAACQACGLHGNTDLVVALKEK